MDSKVRILIAEHSPADLDLIKNALDTSGIDYVSQEAGTERAYINALADFKPDVILSDYNFPSFDGPAAFKLREELAPGKPFIFVSGTIGEEMAVQHIRNGVTDYVLKDKLFSLPHKIVRALKEVKEKLEKDITDEKLRKANNLYAFISQVNKKIVRVKDEKTLFCNSCELAIEFGRFKMAWVGLFDSESQSISLIEQYGIADEDRGLFLNASSRSDGPHEYVLRTGKYFISNDIQNDPTLKDWKIYAALRGINSCIVLPIKKSEKIIGTFNLYSDEYSFLEEQEVRLLVEVANDISFALDLFEKEKKQITTDKKLLENEMRFRALIEKSTDMKTLTDIEGKFIYCSPSMTKVFGFSEEEFFHQSASGFFHPDDIPDLVKNRAAILEQPGKSFSFTYRIMHKNGNWIWCEGTLTNLFHEPGVHALLANFKDISELKVAEQQMEFDQNNLNALINSTKDLLWSVGKDFNLITSNEPFKELGKRNLNNQIVIGENVLLSADSAEKAEHFKKLYDRAFKGEVFTEIEYVDFPVELWTEISYYPILNGKEVIGTACHSRDISEAKMAERKLRRSETFNKGILNSLGSCIAVVDASGTLIAVNESWKRFSVEDEETNLLGAKEGENYYRVCQKLAKLGINAAFDIFEGMNNVMNGKKASFYLEYPSHLLDEKLWFAIRVSKFESHEPMVVVAHENISERKFAEEKLIQSENKLNEAQTIAQLGNWNVNFAAGGSAWSEEACRIYGIPVEEKTLQTYSTWVSYVHPGDIEYVSDIINEAQKTLSDAVLSHRIVLKDGTIKHLYLKSRFEINQIGMPVGLYGIVLDVTDRKLAEEEREKMISNIIVHSKNLEQFAYIVSHNLRAPVASILGISNILKEDLPEKDKKRSQEFLFEAVAHLDEVIKDLNKILQAQSEIVKHKEPVNFLELLTGIKTGIANLTKKEKVEIATDFSEIDHVTTIKSYLHSIFYNLISNSIKYKRPGVKVAIHIKSELINERVRISFKDNGRGIDLAQYGDKLFGLYKRFHLDVEGKGVGLFMIKTQIEVLGGTISVNSEPGSGAEFIIELPS